MVSPFEAEISCCTGRYLGALCCTWQYDFDSPSTKLHCYRSIYVRAAFLLAAYSLLRSYSATMVPTYKASCFSTAPVKLTIDDRTFGTCWIELFLPCGSDNSVPNSHLSLLPIKPTLASIVNMLNVA